MGARLHQARAVTEPTAVLPTVKLFSCAGEAARPALIPGVRGAPRQRLVGTWPPRGGHASAGGRLAEVVDVSIDGTRLISDQGTHVEDPLRQFDSPSGSRRLAKQPSKPTSRPRVAAAVASPRDPDALGVAADRVDRVHQIRLTQACAPTAHDGPYRSKKSNESTPTL